MFGTEKLIFTDGGAWATAGGVFLNADEEDVPGAAIVRASVQDLALWHKVGVADRPSADLALKWLSELPSEQSLSQGYVKGNPETPDISLDCVLKAAGLVEQMGRERMKVRKETEA